jgi:transposase
MANKGAKHLSPQHLDWLLSWITKQTDLPSYREVCSALEKRWGVERDPDTIRRRKEIKWMMEAKKNEAKQQPSSNSGKPTQRRLNQLSAKVQRLRTRVPQSVGQLGCHFSFFI